MMEPIQTADTALRLPMASSTLEDRVARGQDLALRAVDELIDELWRRAANHQLDRGVRLSMPFYDDRRQSLRWRDFTVIPPGRIMFVPAFVVIAAEREIGRVQADRQYTETTRRHLIEVLGILRQAFVRSE